MGFELKHFPFPIGIQLFNRPEYALRMLTSLRNQTLSFNEEDLIIFIDGYKGSLYENRRVEDQTAEVAFFAQKIFPQAKVVQFSKNQGIAKLRNQLQSLAFEGGAPWAAFFEEDLVLDPTYLAELSELISIVNPYNEVAKVACFQVIDSLRSLPRGFDGFYPGHGTQAIAERRSFFILKQQVILKYIDIIEGEKDSYDLFRNSILASEMASIGYLLAYFQHDSLEEQFLHSSGKLHVVSKPNLVTDIGFDGVHSYVTEPLQSETGIVFQSTSERAQNFEKHMAEIIHEADMNIKKYFKEVLDGFYTSKSRKAMILEILKISRSNLRK